MIKNKLANTDLDISLLGLGTVKFGRNTGVKYPQQFELPTDQEVSNLLHSAQDLGINLIDTAPAYGSSEERLGKLLPGKREDWVICSKAGEEFIHDQSSFDFSAQHIYFSVERSLQRLKTDYLDILLIHSNGDDLNIIKDYTVFDCLEKLKQQGKIRSYGMSTKTLEGGLATVNNADVVMLTHNPGYTKEREVITRAHKLNKSVFVKKALASGNLGSIDNGDPVRNAFKFILQEPGITSIIAGTINPQHLAENVAALS